MYVPTHFAPADEDVHQLLDHHGAADLITVGPEGLEATMLRSSTTARGARCWATSPATTTTGGGPTGSRAW